MMRMFSARQKARRSRLKKPLKYACLTMCTALLLFGGATAFSLKPVYALYQNAESTGASTRMTDRHGTPLFITYQSRWNDHDTLKLYEMPDVLVKAFLESEDRRFYNHSGVDWKARIAAAVQNIKQGKSVRGASTLTEQIVRMITPRPRNLWSKWLEGIEAAQLERHVDKNSLLEFYLNQVPYASGRRGVEQAARYYFNRDLDTLTTREMLSLVILARAPSAYDLYKDVHKIDAPMMRLATSLKESGAISDAVFQDINIQTLSVTKPSLPVDARHFSRFALRQDDVQNKKTLMTTLDAPLQAEVQAIIDSRLKKLGTKHVTNAGAIVLDYKTGDILAWVSGGANNPDTKGGDIDPVLAPRQPGSTLKPFLYAMALEKGWTAATFINDAPVREAVGKGLHKFRNYSNTYYGNITLREALGNSLNIPAILTIQYVGVEPFFLKLKDLGFDSLTRDATVYDEGLALGNGEVSLLELVRAYAVLANNGTKAPYHYFMGQTARQKPSVIYNKDVSSIISNILSDPSARMLEFGQDSILNLPVRTAIKTGTSTDYRDAWTVGYNDRYVVGIWMGNLDRKPMKEVTGSTGPALALRSIFGVLNKDRDVKPLAPSPALLTATVCMRPQEGDGECPKRSEYFLAKTDIPATPKKSEKKLELIQPTDGLMVAYDPRIPSDKQKFRFEVTGVTDGDEIEWILNGQRLAMDSSPTYLWPVARGKQNLSVTIHGQNGPKNLPPVSFQVR